MKEEQTLLKTKRNYSDGVFRLLFNSPENLLSLYNALNGTAYTDFTAVRITTLENAIFINIKNDVSCLICNDLSLYEHQTTVCGNMPLRDLLYVTDQLGKMLESSSLYKKKRQMIPTPRFVVLYFGQEDQPEKKILRLSDSFINRTETPQLELIVEQFNLNGDYNRELKEKSVVLGEYADFVQTVRHFRSICEDKNIAVCKAVDNCIERGILKEFLTEQRSEVVKMSIYEFDEEEFLRALKEDYIEEGRDLERANVERERANAERERTNAHKERQRADRLEEELARYIEKYGVLQP